MEGGYDIVHAAIAEMRTQPILGSDRAYDAIDIERISRKDENDS